LLAFVGDHAVNGGLFRDHLGTFLGAFTCNLDHSSIFNYEIMSFIYALEFAAHHGQRNLWIESDSTSALLIFKNASLVLVLLRNRWHSACHLGVQVISSHIFREGNCCADMLASMCHYVQDSVWLTELPSALHFHFFTDRCGLPTYRFP